MCINVNKPFLSLQTQKKKKFHNCILYITLNYQPPQNTEWILILLAFLKEISFTSRSVPVAPKCWSPLWLILSGGLSELVLFCSWFRVVQQIYNERCGIEDQVLVCCTRENQPCSCLAVKFACESLDFTGTETLRNYFFRTNTFRGRFDTLSLCMTLPLDAPDFQKQPACELPLQSD